MMTRLADLSARWRHGTFSSLYVRNYRLYFIGQIISTSGTFMQTVAQAWLVLDLTHSGKALGLATALQYLPILVLAPYGGVVTDRFPKRRILLWTQSVSGALALVLGTLVATGAVRLWMVYILAACLGLVNVFDNPTRQTFHIELVGAENVRNAVTLYSILVNLARIVGPAIAGVLIATVGLAPCFIINGVSFGAVVLMLCMMNRAEWHVAPGAAAQGADPRRVPLRPGFARAGPQPPDDGHHRHPHLRMAGQPAPDRPLHLPRRRPRLRLPHFRHGVRRGLRGRLHRRAQGHQPRQAGRRRPAVRAAVLAAACMPSLATAGLALVAVGFCSINFSSLGNSVLQLNSSPQMRGRVMSLWTLAFLGSTTIGGPIVGWFAEAAGARWGWPWAAWPPWPPPRWAPSPCASGQDPLHHVDHQGDRGQGQGRAEEGAAGGEDPVAAVGLHEHRHDGGRRHRLQDHQDPREQGIGMEQPAHQQGQQRRHEQARGAQQYSAGPPARSRSFASARVAPMISMDMGEVMPATRLMAPAAAAGRRTEPRKQARPA